MKTSVGAIVTVVGLSTAFKGGYALSTGELFIFRKMPVEVDPARAHQVGYISLIVGIALVLIGLRWVLKGMVEDDEFDWRRL